MKLKKSINHTLSFINPKNGNIVGIYNNDKYHGYFGGFNRMTYIGKWLYPNYDSLGYKLKYDQKHYYYI